MSCYLWLKITYLQQISHFILSIWHSHILISTVHIAFATCIASRLFYHNKTWFYLFVEWIQSAQKISCNATHTKWLMDFKIQHGRWMVSEVCNRENLVKTIAAFFSPSVHLQYCCSIKTSWIVRVLLLILWICCIPIWVLHWGVSG